MTGSRESDDETAALIPLDQAEPADGVRVGGASNYFPWTEEEPDVEYTDPDTGPFPWGALVWFVLAAMLACAIGAMVRFG